MSQISAVEFPSAGAVAVRVIGGCPVALPTMRNGPETPPRDAVNFSVTDPAAAPFGIDWTGIAVTPSGRPTARISISPAKPSRRSTVTGTSRLFPSVSVSWSPVKRVPIDGVTSAADHFIPGLAVDKSTSGSNAHLALTYYFYPDATCSGGCQVSAGYTTRMPFFGSSCRNPSQGGNVGYGAFADCVRS